MGTYFALSVGGAAVTVYVWTIRQSLTPHELLGKMNGAFRFCVTGIMPFGAGSEASSAFVRHYS